MSTGIGFGIAIPHCSSDRLEEVVAAFGRSTTGIEFDALDNAPVKFVVRFHRPEKSISNAPAHAGLDRKIFERSLCARSLAQNPLTKFCPSFAIVRKLLLVDLRATWRADARALATRLAERGGYKLTFHRWKLFNHFSQRSFQTP